jgi:two-component system sensor histidine kinase UhpB
VAGQKISARRDVALMAALSVMAALVCIRWDLSEKLMAWAHLHERYQVDELPAVLLVIATCLIWFSTRRYLEARRQLQLRTSVEAKLADALAENQRLTQQYVRMQENERKALARDLHDDLGQYLNVIKLDAVAIRDATHPGDLQRQAARGMIDTVDRMYDVVSGLIRQLRPVGFDELGVAAALEHCVNDWRTRLGAASVELAIETRLDALEESRALALFRLVQEAMTNVVRHSRAKEIRICILGRTGASGAETVVVSVSDDGVGADLHEPHTGLGLVGMRERLAAFGGSLNLTSAPGAGFSLTAMMPVRGPASEAPE